MKHTLIPAWGTEDDRVIVEAAASDTDNLWLTITRDGETINTFLRADEAEEIGLALLKAAAEARARA